MRFRRSFVAQRLFILCLVLVLSSAVRAHDGKSSKSDVTGRYEGTAIDNENQPIAVAFDLTEKDGAVSGNISSSHGDFTSRKGSRQGDTVTLEFDANGTTGTISLKRAEDKLTGT